MSQSVCLHSSTNGKQFLFMRTSASGLVRYDGYSLRLSFTIGITALTLRREIRTSQPNFLSSICCSEVYICREEKCRRVMESTSRFLHIIFLSCFIRSDRSALVHRIALKSSQPLMNQM